MNRRTLTLGAVAVGAAAAGAGWAWWHQHQTRSPRASELPWWHTRFERPQGGDLGLVDFQGQVLVVNFWATWCPPCIEEMPLLDGFAQQQRPKGWQVLGLALDNMAAVQSFLKRIPVSFPIAIAGLTGLDLSRQLGNDKGQLPFTVVWDRQGRLRQVHLGPLQDADLSAWAQQSWG
ncbi:MAG: TlpA disulfide reductase family protein [Burkholderiales bacterium]